MTVTAFTTFQFNSKTWKASAETSANEAAKDTRREESKDSVASDIAERPPAIGFFRKIRQCAKTALKSVLFRAPSTLTYVPSPFAISKLGPPVPLGEVVTHLIMPDEILSKLQTAVEVLREASGPGHTFKVFQQMDDPSIVNVIGTWPSVEAHNAFLVSRQRNNLLNLFREDLLVEGKNTMQLWHLDTDVFALTPGTDLWMSSVRNMCYQRWSIPTRRRAEIQKEITGLMHNERMARRRVVGGFRIEKGPGDMELEEFMIFYVMGDILSGPLKIAIDRYNRLSITVGGSNATFIQSIYIAGDISRRASVSSPESGSQP